MKQDGFNAIISERGKALYIFRFIVGKPYLYHDRYGNIALFIYKEKTTSIVGSLCIAVFTSGKVGVFKDVFLSTGSNYFKATKNQIELLIGIENKTFNPELL